MEDVARQIVDSGLKIHKQLRPGLLEPVYEHCLARELDTRGVAVQRPVAMPVVCDSIGLDASYRIDLPVGSNIIVEIQAVDPANSLHEGPILTCLKLSGYPIGFVLNFNVALFRHRLKSYASRPSRLRVETYVFQRAKSRMASC